MTLTTQNSSIQQIKVLDELIDNAIGLPLGSQDLLLMMAKAMRCTRDCMARSDETESSYKTAPRN